MCYKWLFNGRYMCLVHFGKYFSAFDWFCLLWPMSWFGSALLLSAKISPFKKFFVLKLGFDTENQEINTFDSEWATVEKINQKNNRFDSGVTKLKKSIRMNKSYQKSIGLTVSSWNKCTFLIQSNPILPNPTQPNPAWYCSILLDPAQNKQTQLLTTSKMTKF